MGRRRANKRDAIYPAALHPLFPPSPDKKKLVKKERNLSVKNGRGFAAAAPAAPTHSYTRSRFLPKNVLSSVRVSLN